MIITTLFSLVHLLRPKEIADHWKKDAQTMDDDLIKSLNTIAYRVLRYPQEKETYLNVLNNRLVYEHRAQAHEPQVTCSHIVESFVNKTLMEKESCFAKIDEVMDDMKQNVILDLDKGVTEHRRILRYLLSQCTNNPYLWSPKCKEDVLQYWKLNEELKHRLEKLYIYLDFDQGQLLKHPADCAEQIDDNINENEMPEKLNEYRACIASYTHEKFLEVMRQRGNETNSS